MTIKWWANAHLFVLALLLAAAPARAQAVKLPEKIEAKPGRLVAVSVDYDGDDVRWDVPPAFDCFREYDPDPKKVRLRLLAPPETPAGDYRLIAVAAKGGKLSPFSVCVVTVPGTPTPPTPPQPPAPTDTLALMIQAAYAADPDPAKATYRDQLAAAYQYGLDTLASHKTLGDLFSAVASKAPPAGKMTGERQAIGVVLNATLSSPSAPADPAVVTPLFNRVVAALKGAR